MIWASNEFSGSGLNCSACLEFWLKHFVPQSAMIKLYCALVHPQLLYGLINNLSLYIPRFRTARLQRFVKYKGVKIWNAIPANIQTGLKGYFKLILRNILWVTTSNNSLSSQSMTFLTKIFWSSNRNYLISRVAEELRIKNLKIKN